MLQVRAGAEISTVFEVRYDEPLKLLLAINNYLFKIKIFEKNFNRIRIKLFDESKKNFTFENDFQAKTIFVCFFGEQRFVVLQDLV